MEAEKAQLFLLQNSTLEWKCATEVIASATSNAGAVAALAKERKLALYGNLVPSQYFVPVAFETSGVISPQSRLFLKELDHPIKLVTGEARSAIYLLNIYFPVSIIL